MHVVGYLTKIRSKLEIFWYQKEYDTYVVLHYSKMFILIIVNNSSAPDPETEETTIPVGDLPR